MTTEQTLEERIAAAQGQAITLAEGAAGVQGGAAIDWLAGQTLEIATVEQAQASTELLKSIKDRAKQISELRLTITRPMDAAKKAVMDAFKPATDKLAEAERTLKSAVLAWTDQQARIRREAQRQRDAAAEAERERLATEAVEAEEAGDTEKAEALLEDAVDVRTPEVAPVETPGPAHVRETWSAEVTDLRALVKAVADGSQLLDFIQPNMAALHVMARERHDPIKIPGVKAVSKQGIASR